MQPRKAKFEMTSRDFEFAHKEREEMKKKKRQKSKQKVLRPLKSELVSIMFRLQMLMPLSANCTISCMVNCVSDQFLILFWCLFQGL